MIRNRAGDRRVGVAGLYKELHELSEGALSRRWYRRRLNTWRNWRGSKMARLLRRSGSVGRLSDAAGPPKTGRS
jgi:hypothetical protein